MWRIESFRSRKLWLKKKNWFREGDWDRSKIKRILGIRVARILDFVILNMEQFLVITLLCESRV